MVAGSARASTGNRARTTWVSWRRKAGDHALEFARYSFGATSRNCMSECAFSRTWIRFWGPFTG
jgi:hypothetical protein